MANLEKLVEELFFDPANAFPTVQPRILRAPPASLRGKEVGAALLELSAALAAGNEAEVRRQLFAFVEE